MPITELLERNAANYPSDVALIEINPKIQENKRVTWKEYELIQPTKTQAYRLAFPNCKTEKLTTLYPKASRLANTDKVRARILALEKQIADSALMSTTEYYGHLNEEIRKGGKGKGAALKIVAQIKGLLQADKGQPGSAEAPFVICLERSSEGGQTRAPKN